MKYAKYHGLGNDYLIIDADSIPGGRFSPQQIVASCDRNFGVGSDGIVVVEEERAEGIVVRVFNPDGSEAENSGNGMRIVSRYLYDTGRVGTQPFTLLVGGQRRIRGQIFDAQHAIQVDMGRASFVSTEIPVIGPEREVLNEDLEIAGEVLKITCVNVGNPHCVIFNHRNIKGAAKTLGALVEAHEYFPRRINVQFAQVIDRKNIRIEIWERGAGYTLASGSSSCAAASAARRLGLVDSKVSVHMPGGTLTVEIADDYQLRLTGPVTKIAQGEIDPEVFSRIARTEGLYAEGRSLRVGELLAPGVCLDDAALRSVADRVVSSITADSREVRPGSLFFAIAGAKVDARAFIAEALEKGAVAVVCEATGKSASHYDGALLNVSDVRRALSFAADVFFGKPSLMTTNIAVTGTSGKTSVAWILAHSLHFSGVRTFLGGTLGFKLLSEGEHPARDLKEMGNTTIDPISVNRYLVDAVRNGAQATVFESTSQGLVQRRMRDMAWDIAIYTNLSRDHLDIHGTMEVYEAAKRELFTSELLSSPKQNRVAIINGDDAAGQRLAHMLRDRHPEIRVLTLSQQEGPGVDFVMRDLQVDIEGTSCTLVGEHDEICVTSSFVGAHNAYNVGCVAIALHTLGYSPAEICERIARVPVVPGRVELVADTFPRVFVDYAHKPDALEKMLAFLKPLCQRGEKVGRLINVFGCGGERDTGKRPLMGGIAARLADVNIITSDNPRTEDPLLIIDQIRAGIPESNSSEVIVEPNRRQAIYRAIQMAQPEDLVVIAGKGHEPYQEIQGIKYPFNDIHVAREAIASRS